MVIYSYMWQLFSFSSLFCKTLEEAIDKATLVKYKSIDSYSSTWIRNFIFLFLSILSTILISQKLPVIVITIPIIILGVFYAINSILYTVLLKEIEITSSSIMSTFTPLIFLPIDIFIVGKKLIPRQIFGILILVIGGIVFFKRSKINAQFTKKKILMVIGIFLFSVTLQGFESYLFQSLFIHKNLSEANFLVSLWSVVFLFLTIFILCRCLISHQRPNVKMLMNYSGGSLLSKVADYGNSFFFFKALSIASASQVSSMEVFYPILLIFVVILIQHKFGFNLEEIVDRKSLTSKLQGIMIICLGAILVR